MTGINQGPHRSAGGAGYGWSRAIAVCLVVMLGANLARGAIWTDGVLQPDGFTVRDGDAFSLVKVNGSILNITGGVVEELSGFILNSEINISGGRVGTIWFSRPAGRVDPHAPRTVVNISGGEVEFLQQWGSVGSFISGGYTERLVVHSTWSEITGGGIGLLELSGGGTAVLFGRDFNFPLGDIAATSGTLTGILSDGSALNMAFTRGENATLRLVPEPGGLGIVLLGVWAMVRRSRTRFAPNLRRRARCAKVGWSTKRLVCVAAAMGLGANAGRVDAQIFTDGVMHTSPFTVTENDIFSQVQVTSSIARVLSIAGGEVGEVTVLWSFHMVHMSGGVVGDIRVIPCFDRCVNRSIVHIQGGEVALLDMGAGSATLSGGHLGELRVRGAAYTEITGGSIETLELTGIGTAVLFGRDFNFPLGDLAATSGTLTGILSDGSALNMAFRRGENATLRLVPEPGGLGIVLLGVWAMGGRGRRSVGPQ